MRVKIKRLHSEDLPIPQYMTEGASGLDLYAAVEEPVGFVPLGRKAIPTGIAMEIPEGIEAQIRPRSGLALNRGITVLNTPGTIDSDYRGEVKILLVNLSSDYVNLKRGERIAQMVFSKVERPVLEVATELSETERGEGGFGHTGV